MHLVHHVPSGEIYNGTMKNTTNTAKQSTSTPILIKAHIKYVCLDNHASLSCPSRPSLGRDVDAASLHALVTVGASAPEMSAVEDGGLVAPYCLGCPCAITGVFVGTDAEGMSVRKVHISAGASVVVLRRVVVASNVDGATKRCMSGRIFWVVGDFEVLGPGLETSGPT